MPVLNGALDGGLAIVQVRVDVRPSRAQLRRMQRSPPAPVQTPAFLDTGSTVTLIDPSIVSGLGLTVPSGHAQLAGTTGAPATFPSFHVSLTILHPLPRQSLYLPSFPVVCANIAPLGYLAILGSNVLERCVLVWNGPAQQFTLSY